MRAVAVRPSRREIALVEHEEPRLVPPTGVMVRIRDVGIRGTDRELRPFQHGSPLPEFELLVIGQESPGAAVRAPSGIRNVLAFDGMN